MQPIPTRRKFITKLSPSLILFRRAVKQTEALAALALLFIGRVSRGGRVRFGQPNVAVSKIIEKRVNILVADFASPDNFRVVDVSAVVHPFFAGIVIGRISDDDELFAGCAFELGRELGAIARVLVVGIARMMP